MTRVLLAAALLATVACTRNPERRLAATVEEVKQGIRGGNFDNAQAIAERGLAGAPPDSTWAWTFRLYRAEALIERRKLTEAQPVLDASLPPDPSFDALRARQKYLAAEVLLRRNRADFAGALKTLGEARRLAPAASDLPLEIGFQEAQALFGLGKPLEAEETLNAVIHQAETRSDGFMQARGWNNLGVVALKRGRWDEAATRFERALSFAGLEQTTVFAGTLTNAGAAYGRLGEFDRALKLQQRALSFYVEHGPLANHVSALGEIGNTYVEQGEPEAALPYYQKALAVAKDANVPAALWAGNLAVAQIELGRWDEAARFNEEARRLKIVQGLQTMAYNDLNTAQIALGREQVDEADRDFQHLLADPGAEREVRWQAHAGLAKVALARRKAAEARTHFEAALDSIEQTQINLSRTDFQLAFLNPLIEFYQAYIDALVDQGQPDRAFEIADSSRGRVLASRTNSPAPPKATAAAVRQLAAQSKTVLLSYWLGRKRSYLWVIAADGVHLERLPPAGDIAALVRQYNGVIADALADPLASQGNAGDRLYELVIKPASAWLPRGTRVILVVDGALHGLNFETLPVAGATRHYWIEDVELQTTPGLSMLAAQSPAAGPPSLLVIGDPVAHAAEFPALQFAGAEIDGISKYFPDSTVVYRGPQASPEAYKGAAPSRFSFVHFATHASANLESPLDSAVILSGRDGAFKLYARDVAGVPLRAELVTVSACRSAGERIYSGEGLVGFAWAFLRAGSRRVIAGLWDVDDRSTSELMDHLYAGLAAGRPPAEALRTAKLALIAKGGNYRKPYYWGPFQLFTVVP